MSFSSTECEPSRTEWNF